MKETIKEIIAILQEVVKEMDLGISDAELMDFAIRIYNTQKIPKKEPPQYNSKYPKKEYPISPQEPISNAQIYKLKALGYEGDSSKLSKREAHAMIKEKIESNEKRGRE